jgi:Spx/MgsR family transcriptional regulator
MPITLYGLKNCDTVRRAREWLASEGRDVHFHDFKAAGVPPDRLDAWLAALGWERVLNRKGTSWRQLGDDVRAGVVDAASARAVMLAQPSTIKRPVVEWGDGTVTNGFDAADWARR